MNAPATQSEIICTMIERAALAGAYSALARVHPEAKAGLLKLRDKHSATAAQLAGLISGDAA